MTRTELNELLSNLQQKLETSKIRDLSLKDNGVEFLKIQYDNAHWNTYAYLDKDFEFYTELKEFFENKTLIDVISVKRTDKTHDLVYNNISRATRGLK